MDAALEVGGMIVDQVGKAIVGTQTEILIFILAFGIHALFFGKLRMPRKVARTRMEVRNTSPAVVSAFGGPTRTRSQRAKALAKEALRFCEEKQVMELVAEVSVELEEAPAEDTLDVLAALLEGAGKNATASLCGAVREIIRVRGLAINVELGESLMRSYYGLRLHQDFDEVFEEVQALHGNVPSIGMLALRSALRAGNFEACLARLGPSRQFCWDKDAGVTPSGAPTAVLQQLTRLAKNERLVLDLLHRLKDLGILPGFIDIVVSDCALQNDADKLAIAVKFAEDNRVQLGESAYAAMIRTTRFPKDALSLFMKAASIKPPVNELLTAASCWALEHCDATLADAVLTKLPRKPPAEAVGCLLQWYGLGGVTPPGNDTDAFVLRMYTERFQDVDLSCNVRAMRIIIKAALRNAGRNPGTETTIPRMLQQITESARVNLIKIFGQDKDPSAVLYVLRAGPPSGVCIFNAAMDACIECNNIDDAEQVMSSAVRAGVADTVTYNTIVKAYLQAKRPKDARRAVEAMKAAGFQPNGVTCNELLDPIVKKNIEDAWPVLDEMRALGLRPNRITCAILLKAVQAHSKAADVERVLSVLDEIDEDLDEVLLCSVVDACIRASRPDLLMPHLRNYQVARKQIKCSHTYGSIIRAYGFVHDITGVWNAWREMRTRHIHASAITLGCMVEALASNNQVEAAYELINEMLCDEQWRPLVNAVIYCSVLKGFSHQKRFDRMWAVYQEMLSRELQFSIVTFNTLVDACSRNGEMAYIPGLLEDMVAQGIPPNIITYSAIVKGYCQHNRIDEAFSVLEGMVSTTTFKPDEIMYNTLLDGCARQGLYDRGMGVLKEMRTSGIPPTNFTLSVVVKLASRCKRLETAFELCQEISTEYKFRLNVHVYSNLINACIINKDLSRAFRVFETMVSERVRPDARAYTLLLRACVADKNAKDAAGILRAAFGIRNDSSWLCKQDARRLQPQGGLPGNLVAEILEGIALQCNDEATAVALLKEMRGISSLKLDPKLQLRLATSAIQSNEMS